ncbi:AraC family transcriptional regulator, arabinose operon regulatory protein [Actinacidiphila yanglinensis]|uniref:AraC family transcriptional regulator, arabinose operon regulatory protein n=1 Tax=Actinacidiphila yanglinensis TaxID=310779 RepID=A0A1H6AX36_9ACTN|nr:helix-turn-helix domain-containing protein [Actinacidiphila yanglinensis]SEG52972.1 AraC family transcriptional regulator, arabinose operon regulatory protein [Actinacidiphila yanglinensis]
MWTQIPEADLLSAGRFEEHRSHTVHRAHGARNWMVSLTVSGAAEYLAGVRRLTTGPGDLVLITPGTPQHYRARGDDPWGYWWTHFQPRPSWFDWLRMPEFAPGLSVARLGTGEGLCRADAAFARVHRNAMYATVDAPQGRVPVARGPRHGGYATELALNGIEELLLMAAVEHASRATAVPDPRVRRVLDLITADPAAPLRVDRLAREVALSSSRLAHLFRAETGDSIGNVVLAARLRRAATLLETTGLPVGRIAAEVGFASPYYFSRQFRHRFGMPPTTYRSARGRA